MPTLKTVLFINPFDFDFTHSWDNEVYNCPAGKKMYLPDFLAHHLAKHLVDAKLNREKLPTDFRSADTTHPHFKFDRDTLLKACLIDEETTTAHSSTLKQDIEILNKEKTQVDPASTILSTEIPYKPFCDSCDSKGMRHKKICPKNPNQIALQPEVKEQVEALNPAF